MGAFRGFLVVAACLTALAVSVAAPASDAFRPEHERSAIEPSTTASGQGVASGGKFITSTLAERLAGYLDGSKKKLLHEQLSDREYQVFSMIAKGNNTREIAETLGLSPKTISAYRRRILAKMQVDNDVEIVRYAVQEGLVQ